jgi:hypothetical protein
MSRRFQIGLATLVALVVTAAILAGTVYVGSDTVERPQTSNGVLARFDTGLWTYSDSLVLREDRNAVLVHTRAGKRGTKRFRLTADEAALTEQLLDDADLDDLERSYHRGEGNVDSVLYQVTHAGVTVSTDAESIEMGEVPPDLVRVIRFLDRIITDQAPRRT